MRTLLYLGGAVALFFVGKNYLAEQKAKKEAAAAVLNDAATKSTATDTAAGRATASDVASMGTGAVQAGTLGGATNAGASMNAATGEDFE